MFRGLVEPRHFDLWVFSALFTVGRVKRRVGWGRGIVNLDLWGGFTDISGKV